MSIIRGVNMRKKIITVIISGIIGFILGITFYDDLLNKMYESQNKAGLAGDYNIRKETTYEHDTTYEESNK